MMPGHKGRLRYGHGGKLLKQALQMFSCRVCGTEFEDHPEHVWRDSEMNPLCSLACVDRAMEYDKPERTLEGI